MCVRAPNQILDIIVLTGMSLQTVDQSERATAAATIAAANSEAQAGTTTRSSAVRLPVPLAFKITQIVSRA